MEEPAELPQLQPVEHGQHEEVRTVEMAIFWVPSFGDLGEFGPTGGWVGPGCALAMLGCSEDSARLREACLTRVVDW